MAVRRGYLDIFERLTYLLLFNRLAVVVQLTVSLGMALTFPLQFFVPIQIMLPSLFERSESLKSRPLLVELLFRGALVLVICECTSSIIFLLLLFNLTYERLFVF